MKAIALPREPPSSMSCRARSAPIDNRAASAAEKKAEPRKQINRPKISKFMEVASGGSIEQYPCYNLSNLEILF